MSIYTCFRIFNVNYIDINILANYEASSENVQFPVTNAFNQNRRSKVYRTAGYWNITSSSNRLVFRETTGVDLTAVLNTGVYRTSTAFIAELKRALEDAGASTYTITYVNQRLQFVSDGGGGGGIFEMYTTGSTIAAEIGLTSNKTGSLTALMDTPMIHGTLGEFIEWDMGVATNPDAFIAVDQKDSSLKISPTAVIKLQANETGNFSSPSYETTITYDDEVLSVLSNTGLADKAYRYWRLSIYDPANPNGYIQLGAFFLGNYMSWARARAGFPLSDGYEDRSVTIFSEGGQSFADIKTKTQVYGCDINALEVADKEELDIFFLDFGTSKPFFISMDSEANFSSNKNRRIKLVKFVSEPQPTFVVPNYWRTSMLFREEI